MTRAAIYARYSSDRQSERSAEDQARLCQERAAKEGWEIAGVFSDLALSGATRDRPGLNALLDAAERFDVVLAEHTDRLSRDQEDIAAIWKRLRFAGARLVTLSQGEVNELHVGVGGTMAALFLKELGEKTRRGQVGRVEAGRIPGGLSYGYALEPGVDARGRPDRGRRRIDPAQAAIVRRIFAAYLAGEGPKAIAQALNRECVSSPAGASWGASTILGNRRRGTGILHNELYVGRIIYNRQRFEKHPVTRKRVAKLNPPEEWRFAEVPELAILDRATWDAVQLAFAAQGDIPAPLQRRPQRLLSGLIRCGVCGGGFTVATQDYWGCSQRRKGSTCTNAGMIRTDALEERVLGALRDRMLAPDLIAEVLAEEQRLVASDRAARLRHRGAVERRLARAQAQIERAVDAIVDGRSTMPELSGRLRALEAERDGHAVELTTLAIEPTITAHPNLAAAYSRQVADLVEALRGPTSSEARTVIRDMIEGIIATPRATGGVDLDLQGRLAAILALSTGEPAAKRHGVTTMVVAGTGFEPVTFRL